MKELDYVEVGNRIREARKAQNLTQEKAAEQCNITSSFYGNIERGNKKMSVDTLAKVCVGLFVSADTLLFGATASEGSAIRTILDEIQRNADESQFEKHLLIISNLSTIVGEL